MADVPRQSPALFDLHRARALVDGQNFIKWWGLQVTAVGDGTASVRLPAAEHLLRPGGVLHGSCYEVTADVAMWLAIMTRVGEEPMAVTVEMKTNFLRGTDADITATARLLKVGARLAVGTAEVLDARGRTVAFCTLTYARPRQPMAGSAG